MDWKNLENQEKREAYYASREWAEKRRAVHKRAGGKCERCKKNRIAAVHHLTYIRLYNEELTDLQAICQGCHDFTHAKNDYDPAVDSEMYPYIGTGYFSFAGDETLDDHSGGWGDTLKLVSDMGIRFGYTGYFVGESSEEWADNFVAAIHKSDFLFAWITFPNQFRTFAEITVARRLRKDILIGYPKGLELPEAVWEFIWDATGGMWASAESPMRALRQLAKDYELAKAQ